VSGLQYDLNGNIERLERNGKDGAELDDLSYSYAHGNQLSKVEDNATGTISDEGFKNGATQNTEYTYDANGNMITDVNKGIVKIDYNHLNLPERVDMGSNNWIEYEYDASGIKLRQKVFITLENSFMKTTLCNLFSIKKAGLYPIKMET